MSRAAGRVATIVVAGAMLAAMAITARAGEYRWK